MQEALLNTQNIQKQQYDKQVQASEFNPRQIVFLLLPSTAQKITIKWQGPIQVLRKVGGIVYMLQLLLKGPKIFHANLLKTWNAWEELVHCWVECDWLKKEEELTGIGEDEDKRLSEWQLQQMYQILWDFLGVF